MQGHPGLPPGVMPPPHGFPPQGMQFGQPPPGYPGFPPPPNFYGMPSGMPPQAGMPWQR